MPAFAGCARGSKSPVVRSQMPGATSRGAASPLIQPRKSEEAAHESSRSEGGQAHTRSHGEKHTIHPHLPMYIHRGYRLNSKSNRKLRRDG